MKISVKTLALYGISNLLLNDVHRGLSEPKPTILEMGIFFFHVTRILMHPALAFYHEFHTQLYITAILHILTTSPQKWCVAVQLER